MSPGMLGSYARLALRVLRRRPFFTGISLFGIAVTLGVLLVATAIVDHLFGAHAPESRAGRMLAVTSMLMSGPQHSTSGSCGYGFLERVVPGLSGVERHTLFDDAVDAAFVDGRRVESMVKRTDGGFFDVFDFEFVAGGPYGPADDDAGNPVAVINRSTARRFFGDGDALGREIPVFGRSYRVLGVVDDVAMTRKYAFGEIWIPLGTAESSAFKAQWRGDFAAVVLLEPDADAAGVKRQFAEHVASLQLPDPVRYDHLESWLETQPEAVARQMFGGDRDARSVGLLWATVAAAALLFMLLPAVNLVNLNLSRILERAGEIGVRKSFGASSAALVAQFIVENVVLTAIGATLGVAFAVPVLWALNVAGPIPYAEFALNLRVLGYGVVLTLTFGLLSGAWPAWRMSRLHPVDALRGRAR